MSSTEELAESLARSALRRSGRYGRLRVLSHRVWAPRGEPSLLSLWLADKELRLQRAAAYCRELKDSKNYSPFR